jgi:hypothetical protein
MGAGMAFRCRLQGGVDEQVAGKWRRSVGPSLAVKVRREACNQMGTWDWGCDTQAQWGTALLPTIPL